MNRVLLRSGRPSNLKFPGKRLFGNFKEKCIVDRQHKIETYLNGLAAAINLVAVGEACVFLQIPTETRGLLRLGPSPPAGLKEESKVPGPQLRTPAQDAQVQRIVDFMERLNATSTERQRAVEEFESYYFATRPSLSLPAIQLLLWGNEERRGLLEFCGDTKAYVGSASCTRLLAKLTNCEHNSTEAEKFLEVFCMSTPKVVRSMNLGHHASTTLLPDAGFGLLHHYLSHNGNLVVEPQDLLVQPQDAEEFVHWALVQRGPRTILSS